MFKTVPAACARLPSSTGCHGLRSTHHQERLKRAFGRPSPPYAASLPVQIGSFFAFCELCGTGDGIVPCPACEGAGKVVTKPGGAGVPLLVGLARCKVCNGQGRIPCMLCAGTEVRLPPPNPFGGPVGEASEDDGLGPLPGISGASPAAAEGLEKEWG